MAVVEKIEQEPLPEKGEEAKTIIVEKIDQNSIR